MNTSARTTQKRKAILQIALKVFAKEGFGNADVQVIADLAGVGKGTVYRHFGNKQQLFMATAKFCLTEVGDFIVKEVGSEEQLPELLETLGTLGILRAIGISYAKFYQLHPEAVEIMIQERSEFRESVYPSHLMHREETRDSLDQFLKLAIERQEIRDVDVRQATNAFADLLFGSVVNGCLEGSKANLVGRVTQAVDFFLYGLSAKTLQLPDASTS